MPGGEGNAGLDRMMTCKTVAEQVSSLGFEELSWHRRLSIRLHLLMCSACRLYLRQIRRIRSLAHTSYTEQTLSPAELERLEREILSELFASSRHDE